MTHFNSEHDMHSTEVKMIRRDYYVNPYHDHARMNGIRHAQTWRDQQAFDDGMDAARGIVHALVLGAMLWAAILVPLAFVMGWLE